VAASFGNIDVIQVILNLAENNLTTEKVNKLLLVTDN
jgi:hypothetical protein